MFNDLIKKDIIKRYVIFMIGIMFVSLGIALIVKSNLGTSPISSIPYVLTFIFPLSLGTFTFIFNMAFIAIQVILLKGNFPKIQYLQIIMVLIFGIFIDALSYLVSFIQVESYLMQLTLLAAGCIVQAIGISLEVMADVIILPGEGIVKTISKVFKKEFGKVKTTFDISLVAASALISLLFLHKIVGLREGTVIAAFCIGTMSKFIKKRLEYLFDLLNSKNADEMA